MNEQYVSARRAAELTGKVERTVRRWIERGKLQADRDPTSGEFLIPLSALGEFGYKPEPELDEATPEPIPPWPLYPSVTAGEGWIERAVRAETRLDVALYDMRQLARIATEMDGKAFARIAGVLLERWQA